MENKQDTCIYCCFAVMHSAQISQMLELFVEAKCLIQKIHSTGAFPESWTLDGFTSEGFVERYKRAKETLEKEMAGKTKDETKYRFIKFYKGTMSFQKTKKQILKYKYPYEIALIIKKTKVDDTRQLKEKIIKYKEGVVTYLDKKVYGGKSV